MFHIFTCLEANFVPATVFPEMGKQGNIHKKDVSQIMLSSLPGVKLLETTVLLDI